MAMDPGIMAAMAEMLGGGKGGAGGGGGGGKGGSAKGGGGKGGGMPDIAAMMAGKGKGGKGGEDADMMKQVHLSYSIFH